MTPEQQAAKVLNKTNLPEFAAARGYYTMFYIASAFLEGEGLAFSRHSAVISAFGQRFANTGRVPVEFHRYLIAAEQIRCQADYNINPGLTEEQAQEQIERAEEFLELAEQLLGSIPPT